MDGFAESDRMEEVLRWPQIKQDNGRKMKQTLLNLKKIRKSFSNLELLLILWGLWH